MVWAGEPFSQLVEFNVGVPTGALTFVLKNDAGTTLYTQTVTPDAGALSYLIIIPSTYDTCASGLFEGRLLSWLYSTASTVVSGRIGYRVYADLPFVVSPQGVRDKLGVEPHELRDEQIDLVLAYSEVAQRVDLSGVEAGSRTALLVVHAIEAMAGLLVLPTLQVSLASKESSGTNSYQRSAIDWEQIEAALQGHIARLSNEVLPSTDDGLGVITFQTAPRSPDSYTGV